MEQAFMGAHKAASLVVMLIRQFEKQLSEKSNLEHLLDDPCQGSDNFLKFGCTDFHEAYS